MSSPPGDIIRRQRELQALPMRQFARMQELIGDVVGEIMLAHEATPEGRSPRR